MKPQLKTPGILGAKLLEEFTVNGPGTVKQLAEAIGADPGEVFSKLVGMRRDELVIPLNTYDFKYTVWGPANW